MKTRKQYDHELIKKAQKGGDKARAELVERHIALVHSMVHKISRQRHPHDDLVQDGVCGLLEAIDRFDLTRDVHFTTYAVPWIRSAIIKASMQNVSQDKDTRKVYWHGSRVSDEIMQAGNMPTEVAVAGRLGIDPNVVANLRASLAQPIEYDEDRASSCAGEFSENPESLMIQKADILEIKKAMLRLSPREQDVINQHYFKTENGTLQSTGKAVGVSGERVRQIEAVALRKLKTALEIARRHERF